MATEETLAYVWKAVVPSVAILIQAAFENFFNGAFPKAINTTSTETGEAAGSGPQCTGNLELVLRTIAFVITLLVGLIFMKWKFSSTEKLHKDHQWRRRWFHYTMNFVFVFSWLFAISDFPLACWINKDGALTSSQLIIVSFTKFVTGTIVVNVGVLISHRRWPRCLAGSKLPDSPPDPPVTASEQGEQIENSDEISMTA